MKSSPPSSTPLREAALRGGNREVVEQLHEIVETYTPDESVLQAG